MRLFKKIQQQLAAQNNVAKYLRYALNELNPNHENQSKFES